MSGIVSRPLGATYSCTKFALEALSDTLRMELAAHDVRTVVCRFVSMFNGCMCMYRCMAT